MPKAAQLASPTLAALPAAPAKQADPAAIKRVSPQQEADYLYALAQSPGNAPTQARSQLQRCLGLMPTHTAARLLLAQMQEDAGLHSDADATLAAGLVQTPGQLDVLTALLKLKVAHNAAPAAAALLAGYTPMGREPAEFHALAAAILLKAGNPAAAAAAYRRALASMPEQASWWVGLGMALKESGQAGAAREAYLQALQVGGLSAGLSEYVQKQLSQLPH